MRSSAGAHYIALDHVRAVAAFLVFTWHFLHAANGYPVPFEYVPMVFPLAILDEGHTGVALFMTLSGYLFAKLLDGKQIDYRAFLWNRFVRLVPLLALVIFVVGAMRYADGVPPRQYVLSILKGLVVGTLPNGGWSIVVEFHFYLLLPLLLWLSRKYKLLPISILAMALLVRVCILGYRGEVQTFAYWTIVGRVDQFALGILLFQFRAVTAKRHVAVACAAIAFATFYWYFDKIGGFYQFPSYPSPSRLWLVLTTIEGFVYALVIAWYDTSFVHSTTGLSKFIGKIGEFSYSIYLLHFFFVFQVARLVHEHIMDIANFYLACCWSMLLFLCMVPVGFLSFHCIEAPFLRLRRRYVRPASPEFLAPQSLSATSWCGRPSGNDG